MDGERVNEYGAMHAHPNNQIWGVLTLFILVLTALMVYSVFWGPIKQYVDSFPPNRVINVSAEGKSTVIPDIARLSFSVVSDGTDPGSLADENNRKMNGAIDAVKAIGIDKKDIQTTQYSLTPKYSYDRYTGKSSIYAYEMSQTVSLKIRDFSKIGKILGALPQYGINQIGTLSFDVDDPEIYLSDARSQAFAKAKTKAESMAKANGVSLGRVISFSESTGGYPVPYYKETLGMGGAAPAQAAPTIEPGSQEVSVQVSVSYELK